MKKLIMVSLVYLIFAGQSIHAQVDTLFAQQQLKFDYFLQLVSQHNLEYAAEKYNVQISEAAIEMAKIFPDPSFSVEWLENREQQGRVGYGYVTELGTTIELRGKRKARINLAESEKHLTQALLDDYFRNLRADAAIVYLEAVKQNQLYEVKQNSYETMRKLAEADSIRLSLGSIMETDAIQSKLEAGMLLNEIFDSEANRQNAICQLNLMAGIPKNEISFIPDSALKRISKDFELKNLINIAQQNRADLEAARYSMEVAAKTSVLTKRERAMDLDIFLGLENNFALPGAEYGYQTMNAGIAIPLKISNHYKGDLRIAQLYEQQADMRYSYIELKIKTEIVAAYQSYNSTVKQVENFKSNLLNQSEKVLKGKIYSYQRGETSLLEILNAQRTYNAVQTTYIETLYNNYMALIELEKAVGIWDIIL